MPRFIKSKRALAFEESMAYQVSERPFLEGDLQAWVSIWYTSRRPDLDPSLVLDGLQGKWYKNDRAIKKIVCEHYLDKDNPRVFVVVEEIEWDDFRKDALPDTTKEHT
jgi:Holliday junction resolvase RusA-like endonuclease